MTCAETSVWSILEYYGTRYSEYKTILPSTMVRKLEELSYERNLPSRGLSYQAVTALLKTFGFSPRLYAREVYEKHKLIQNFRRIFHYYIESGIPVAVGITRKLPKDDDSIPEITEKHSVVAIGHTKKKKDIATVKPETHGLLSIINTADLYDEYVMMDDNQIPYTTEEYDKFSIYQNGQVTFLSVPLYKRIFLEAQDAEHIFYELLKSGSFGERIKDGLNISDANPLIVRIYLTSSRKFKKMRSAGAASSEECAFYQQLVYPKFLWVAELSTPKAYAQEKVCGEIVLDATADRYTNTNCFVLIRLLRNFSYRLPHFSREMINTYYIFDDKSTNYPYKMYKNNLNQGGYDMAGKKEQNTFIPPYESALQWKKPDTANCWGIDFDSLHENLSKKMKYNAIMEAQSIELAASFRTNS